MSKVIDFPYGITLREGGRVELFPAAEVGIQGKDGVWMTLIFIIDSGAAISALPKGDASVFGIDMKRGKPTSVSGISRQLIDGWRHGLRVRLKNEFVVLPIIFLDIESAPRVLGRAGIFEKFLVVFDEKKHRATFLEEKSLLVQKMRNVIDKNC